MGIDSIIIEEDEGDQQGQGMGGGRFFGQLRGNEEKDVSVMNDFFFFFFKFPFEKGIAPKFMPFPKGET